LGPQGSFQNFTSITNWLTQLANSNSTVDGYNNIGLNVKVVGDTLVSSTYALSYLTPVTFEGTGSITITNDIGFTLGNNIYFRDVQINYLYDATSDGYYTVGKTANPLKAAFYASAGLIDLTPGNVQNIMFDNCLFTSPVQNRFAFLGFALTSSDSNMQDITLTNNRFHTTFDGYDQLAIITFTAPTGFTDSDGNGPRLDNCLIKNNKCNKNQSIVISSPLVFGQVLEMIAASNLQILENTCGAINVLLKRAIPNPIDDDNYNFTQESGAIISGNTCPFIYCGFANGDVVDGYGSEIRIRPFQDNNVISSGVGLFSGYLNISNNVCCYIQVGRKVSFGGNTIGISPLIIKDNQYKGYVDSTFLNAYYDGTLVQNMALIVDEISGT
jgi:hypothetical protein